MTGCPLLYAGFPEPALAQHGECCLQSRSTSWPGGGYAPFAGIGDEWCCSILHVGHHFPEDFNERVTRACALEQGVAKDWCLAVQGDANIHCVPRELQLISITQSSIVRQATSALFPLALSSAC